MGITGKYLVITTASLLITIFVYDVFVRRTNVTRFLFGLKPKRRKTAQHELLKAKLERIPS
jgi:hypothetical protein